MESNQQPPRVNFRANSVYGSSFRIVSEPACGRFALSGLHPLFRNAGARLQGEVFGAAREGDVVAAFGDVPGAAARVEVRQQARIGGEVDGGPFAKFQPQA